jgi:hypothetical protein
MLIAAYAELAVGRLAGDVLYIGVLRDDEPGIPSWNVAIMSDWVLGHSAVKIAHAR